MNQIVKINPSDYGLEEQKAKQISEMFKPMLEKMESLESEFNEVAKMEISKETCDKARELRLKYVKVRTGTKKIHEELKAFYLQGGRFVDGWKNAQLMASQGIEEKLTAIERHYENLELERIAKLSEERASELFKYLESEDLLPDGLGQMPDDVWNNYLTGAKANYKARKEAERKAEEERIAREKAEAEERERIRLENIKLKKEAEERERKEKAEAEKRERAEAARLKKEAEEQAAREEKERKDREAFELKLKKEREEREKAESELQAKREAEEKAAAEERTRKEAELNKKDAAKVSDLVSDLEGLKSKYLFKSKKNQKMYSDVGILIDKVVNHINSN